MNKVTNDVFYIGVNDHQIDLFEGQYLVPHGMSYNSYIIKDEDDLENLNQDNFDDIMLQAINFVEDLFLYRENLIINTQIHMLKDHKEKENIKLFINLIILALKDMFHVKQNEKAVFCNHVEFFDSLTYDNNDIIKKIELLLETSYLLDTNANIPLLMDSMMYRI